MKVIVCGGRDYADAVKVERVLDALHTEVPFTEVIQGGARGADLLALSWGDARGVPVKTFRADWDAHGRAAGPIRNGMMVAYGADLVVAFPGGRGTADMARQARAAGIDVIEIP